MRTSCRIALLFALLAPVRLAHAADSGAFVVQLGQDTTSVERYTRTQDRLEVDQVGRAPRVLRRHFVYEYEKGAIRRFTMVVTPPGSTTPTQTIDATFDADSVHSLIKSGAAPAQASSLAMRPGTLLVPSSSPWASYEGEIQHLLRTPSDTLGGSLYFLGAGASERFLLRRLDRDSVEISNTHGDVYHVRVDKLGHILGSLPIAGTAKFAITRVPSLDLEAMATGFMAREAAGAGVGMLSPRDTVRVGSAGGAALTIDYGRPAKRGRAIFGGIVPYGEVWSTGANAATQFRTDRALDFGGTVVPAGFYTLWTLPTATGWKLILNAETGQWGTQRKPERDLFSIDMKLSMLPQVVERFTISVEPTDRGGSLNLDWDTTRASAEFSTAP